MVYDVSGEAHLNSVFNSDSLKIRSMICVPVLDSDGKILGVVQAINRKGYRNEVGGGAPRNHPSGHRQLRRSSSLGVRRGFTNRDLQVLLALSSHVSVALQTLKAEDGMSRLKDTIRVLKAEGGVIENKNRVVGFRERRPLHVD